MTVLLTILFCVCPLLALFFALVLYIIDKSKRTHLYSAIISFWFGVLAYYFVPLSTYDLVRHQEVVSNLILLPKNNIMNYLNNVDLEIIPKIYSVLISLTKNVNLLQFFIVAIGYFIIFYMLNDYRNKKNIKNIYFIPILFYVVFGFNTLYFFSGLYCYIAIILFSFAFYLEYIKKSNIKVYIPLYILALATHNSMYFPLILLILFKLFKEKFNLKLLLTGLTLFIMSSVIFYFLHIHLKIDIVQKLYRIFYVYTTNNESFMRLYKGNIFYIEIIKLLFTIFCAFINSKRSINNFKINNFVLFFGIMTLLMMFKSIVMIRFIMLVQFIGMIPIIDYFATIKKSNQIAFVLLIVITTLFGIYFFHQIITFNYGNLSIDTISENIVNIMKTE